MSCFILINYILSSLRLFSCSSLIVYSSASPATIASDFAVSPHFSYFSFSNDAPFNFGRVVLYQLAVAGTMTNK